MTYIKKSHTKRNIAIILIIIVSVASATVAYATLTAKKVEIGVKIGDTFTYSLMSTVHLTGNESIASDGFEKYNQTDYYKIIIKEINGTQISMDTLWKFNNGTEITNSQTIDIANGQKSDDYGFWAIYPANLNTADLLRPNGYDGNTVNNTDTVNYANGNRDRCFWRIDNQFSDIRDPTGATLMYDYRNIFFDKETGILTTLENYQVFNNPAKTEYIQWKLVDSSVWDV